MHKLKHLKIPVSGRTNMQKFLGVFILISLFFFNAYTYANKDTFSSYKDFEEKCFHVEVDRMFFDPYTGLLKRIDYHKVPPYPHFNPEHPEDAALDFIQKYFDPYMRAPVSTTLELKDIIRREGFYLVRFKQICDGLWVYLSEVTVRMDHEGRVQSIKANVSPLLSLSEEIRPDINSRFISEVAIKWLAQKYATDASKWHVAKPPQLVVFNPALIRTGENRNIPAWLIGLYSQGERAPRTLLISASKGEVLWEGSSLYEGFGYVTDVCLEIKHSEGNTLKGHLELFFSGWDERHLVTQGFFQEEDRRRLPFRGDIYLEASTINVTLEGPLYRIFPVISYNFGFDTADLSRSQYCRLTSSLIQPLINTPLDFNLRREDSCQVRLIPCEE